jgi:hypothetical protein
MALFQGWAFWCHTGGQTSFSKRNAATDQTTDQSGQSLLFEDGVKADDNLLYLKGTGEAIWRAIEAGKCG